MKKIRKLFSLCLALVLCLCCVSTAFAAEVDEATIDPDAACSLTIYKYDWTNALKDGVWTADSFTSTGWQESYVETVLGGGDANALGNGQSSNGYAIKGVEFSYLKVASIETYSDGEEVRVIYGFDKTAAAGLLSAIGLGDGANRFEAADSDTCYFYTSDTLNKAIADSLAANATTVKDALESYMSATNGAAMPETDANGRSSVSGLPVGLYLLVETAVPEMVTSTTNPFFVSLPMTTVSGNEHSASPEGGHYWNYDVTVYPKNETGIPSLEKTVREAKADTGKNNATNSITDGFDHNATASGGDVMEYQIISTLPTITSNSTALSVYNFYDTLDSGLSYCKNDVKIEIFTDDACTDKVVTWAMDSGKFGVSYSADDRHMTVDISSSGLAELNGGQSNANGNLYRGYSNYTLRLTYNAKVNSSANLVYGENGNDNHVVLTWKRSSSSYYDTLVSDAHVYSFGLDLAKAFSDKSGETAERSGLYDHVKFKIQNKTDGYWVTATLNESEGIYYVTGHADSDRQATVFSPVTSGSEYGKIIVKGLEDDEYILTEVETANGYVLLKDSIKVVITAAEDKSRPCTDYTADVLGVLQNDPYYAYDGGYDLRLSGIPQKALLYNYLTASASVDGNAIEMLTDGGSKNAIAPMKVVNTPGFDLPDTGDNGTMYLSVIGIVVMAGALTAILLVSRKKKTSK